MGEKKLSIYDLYKKEKLINVKGDEGEVSILLVKMTTGERTKALEVLNSIQKEEETRIKADKVESERIWAILNKASKNELIAGILNVEELEQRNELDKFIIPDRDTLTEEEIKKKEEDNLKKWIDERRKYIEKEYDLNSLKEELFAFRVKSLGMIKALYEYDLECLVYMCRQVDTKETIFKSRGDVGKLSDKRLVDFLLEELKKFRRFETEKEVRQAAQDSNFLASGESGSK